MIEFNLTSVLCLPAACKPTPILHGCDWYSQDNTYPLGDWFSLANAQFSFVERIETNTYMVYYV